MLVPQIRSGITLIKNAVQHIEHKIKSSGVEFQEPQGEKRKSCLLLLENVKLEKVVNNKIESKTSYVNR